MCSTASPARAQVTDAGMLPKPIIPHDWHTYVHEAHQRAGGGWAHTMRADTWAGQWGGAIATTIIADTFGQRDLGLAIVAAHSLIDAENNFDLFGVQLQAGLSTRTGALATPVDARGSIGVVTRLSPLFISAQLWTSFDVIAHDVGDDASFRGGVGTGIRMTLHKYLPRAGVQTHLRLGMDQGAAFEFGLHYSTS